MATKRSRCESGAAAVELALVLPLLLLLVFGIIEFGLLLNKQISASNAAREAARYAAIHYEEAGVIGAAQTRASQTAGFLTGISTDVDVSTCVPGSLGSATATVEIDPEFVTGWFVDLFDADFVVRGEGQMVCGG